LIHFYKSVAEQCVQKCYLTLGRTIVVGEGVSVGWVTLVLCS